MNEEQVIEALLFSAGRPLAVEDIISSTGLDEGIVRKALKSLTKSYDKRESAIQITKAGSKYVMQIRPHLLGKVVRSAPTEIPIPVLKTAALIAYYQPIMQSNLQRMVGDKVYEHVRFLADRDLIVAKDYGHTLLLSTSRRFPEYFGIPTTKREDIKRWMAEKVGIKVSVKGKVSETAAVAQGEERITEGVEDGKENCGCENAVGAEKDITDSAEKE